MIYSRDENKMHKSDTGFKPYDIKPFGKSISLEDASSLRLATVKIVVKCHAYMHAQHIFLHLVSIGLRRLYASISQ